MSNPSVGQQTAAGFAWLGSAKLITQVASWVSTIWVARLLVPSDYGLMAMAAVMLHVPEIVSSAGMTEAMIQRRNASRSHDEGVFAFNLLVSGAFYLLIFFAAPAVAAFYGEARLVDIIRVCGLCVVVIAARAMPYAVAMRALNYRYAALVDLVGNLLSTVLVVALAWNGMGVWSLVWAYVVKHLVMTLAYLVRLERWPRPRWAWREIEGTARYGLRLMAAEVMRVTYTQADVFLVGKYLGPRIAGHFSMAYQLATIPLDKIGAIFNRVSMPAIAALQHDRAQGQRLFLSIHHYLLLVAAPMLVGMSMIAEDLVVLLLTEKWRAVGDLLQLLCLVNVFRLSGMVMSPALAAVGRADVVFRFNLLCLFVLVPGFAVGVGYGASGVIAAWLILFPLCYTYLLSRMLAALNISLRRFASTVQAPVLGCVALTLVINSLPDLAAQALWLRLLCDVVAGALAYVAVVLLFPTERRHINSGVDYLMGRLRHA